MRLRRDRLEYLLQLDSNTFECEIRPALANLFSIVRKRSKKMVIWNKGWRCFHDLKSSAIDVRKSAEALERLESSPPIICLRSNRSNGLIYLTLAGHKICQRKTSKNESERMNKASALTFYTFCLCCV